MDLSSGSTVDCDEERAAVGVSLGSVGWIARESRLTCPGTGAFQLSSVKAPTSQPTSAGEKEEGIGFPSSFMLSSLTTDSVAWDPLYYIYQIGGEGIDIHIHHAGRLYSSHSVYSGGEVCIGRPNPPLMELRLEKER